MRTEIRTRNSDRYRGQRYPITSRNISQSRSISRSKFPPNFTRQQIREISQIAKISSESGKEYIAPLTYDSNKPVIGDWICGRTSFIPDKILHSVLERGITIHTHPDTPEEYRGQIGDPVDPSFGDMYVHTLAGKDHFCIASHEQGVMRCFKINDACKDHAQKMSQDWHYYLHGPLSAPKPNRAEFGAVLEKAWLSIPPKEYSLEDMS